MDFPPDDLASLIFGLDCVILKGVNLPPALQLLYHFTQFAVC